MEVEVKDAIREVSARQLLLAPMYLLHEIYAALIPGVLFLLLFLLTSNRRTPAPDNIVS